jgi:nucleoside-diphosphate-sugar epimerase
MWCGYLSTTGVYGDHKGAWVTESSDLRSRRLTSRIEAEKDWLSLVARKRPVGHVFRLAGIYGPGRSAHDTVRRGAITQGNADDDSALKRTTGEATSPTGDAAGSTTVQWVSRVHVDDICRALLASAARPNYEPREGSAAVYNVADDAPAPREEVLNTAAELLGQQRGASSGPLQFRDPGRPSGRPRAGSRENKRVAAAKLKDEVGWEPLYKNHESGLCAILDKEEQPDLPE